MWPVNGCLIENNFCKISLQINKNFELFKNCDIYVGDNDLLFCCNYFVDRISSPQKFDTKDLKNLEINFNSLTRTFSLQLPCLPEIEESNINNNNDNNNIEEDDDIQKLGIKSTEKNIKATNKSEIDSTDDNFDISKLQNIIDSCVLIVDGKINKFNNSYSFGFCGNYNVISAEFDFLQACRIENPLKVSPISRTYHRYNDEIKDFSPDQYKLNFVELQVPEGLENPMKFTFNFDDNVLTKTEEEILNRINQKNIFFHEEQKIEIDCGLISILLAICYDIRTTSNEPTCESSWTRSILSSTLTYFEPIQNLKSVIVIFMRRSLIYPLYRSYDLSRYCVEDVIDCLQKGTKWILKQFLNNYQIFQTSHNDPKQLLNKYFIEDYIRYIKNVITDIDLIILAKNLKNALIGILKKTLQLDLIEIERELLKELIKDIHFTNASSSSDSLESIVSDDDKEEHKNNSDDSINSVDSKNLV